MESASAQKLKPLIVNRATSSADAALSSGFHHRTIRDLVPQHHLRAKFVVTWWTGDVMVYCGDCR